MSERKGGRQGRREERSKGGTRRRGRIFLFWETLMCLCTSCRVLSQFKQIFPTILVFIMKNKAKVWGFLIKQNDF